MELNARLGEALRSDYSMTHAVTSKGKADLADQFLAVRDRHRRAFMFMEYVRKNYGFS